MIGKKVKTSTPPYVYVKYPRHQMFHVKQKNFLQKISKSRYTIAISTQEVRSDTRNTGEKNISRPGDIRSGVNTSVDRELYSAKRISKLNRNAVDNFRSTSRRVITATRRINPPLSY